MEPIKKATSKDFSIIFEEIEKIHEENPSLIKSLVNEDDLQQNETIRAFGDICQEINSSDNSHNVYMTFA